MTDNVSSNVYKKWAAVMGSIDNIDLDSFHPDKKYRYSSGANVMNTVRPILAKFGLILEVKQLTKARIRDPIQGGKGWYNRVFVKWRLVDADNPESKTDWGVSDGEAIDYSGDKGGAAAMTYALKNLVKDVFLVRGEDDADTDKTNGVDWNAQPHQPPQRRQQQPPPPQQRQQQPPPPINAADRFQQQQEPPQQQQTVNGQPQPDQTPTAAKADPESTPEVPAYTAELFKQQASDLGFDQSGYKVTLSRFAGFRNAAGQLTYKPVRHGDMIESLKAWKALTDLMAELELSAEPENELAYLGVNPPYADHNSILNALPTIRKHAEFVFAAREIAGDSVGEVLKNQGLLPWTLEKNDMILQALRASVSAQQLVEEANGDVVEEVADAVDLVTEITVDGDEFSVTSMTL